MHSKGSQTICLGALTLAILFSLIMTSPVLAAPKSQAPWPVVVVTNDISVDTTWTAGNVYFILNDIEVSAGATLTIQGGTIVKFLVPIDPSTQSLTGLIVNGQIRFIDTGPMDANRVIFTSGRDDTAGGDTNADGQQTLPAPGDWDYIRLTTWTNSDPAYEFLNIRYSKDGLNFHNTAAATYAPVFANNVFAENTCGLTFSYSSTGSVLGDVQYNTFTDNKFGFCTRRDNGTGQARPTLTENNFNNNSVLPIYLSGTSYPVYVDNIFTGYIDPSDKLGIGLGGIYNGSGSLTIVDNMPFVIVTPMEVTGAGVNLSIPAGAIIKSFTRYDLVKSTDPIPGLKITAGVTFESNPTEPIIFTSYRDDIGGDTNGDDIDTEPFARDWAGVDFVDKNAPGSANYTFEYLSFRFATNGLLYETTTTAVGARLPVIINSTFIGNLNGLRFKAISNNANSRIEPVIQNCTFENQGILPAVKTDTEPGVPIFLENTVYPAYIGNTFTGNLHPAIGLSGRWRSSATFPAVNGQGLTPMPYLIHGEVWFGDANISGGVDNSATFTLPQGMIIKFFVNNFDRNVRSNLIAAARLQLLSTTTQTPIVFTSYYDRLYGGNTDGIDSIEPVSRDWGVVTVRHPESDITYTVFRYGDKALQIENKSPNTAVPFDAQISNNIFEYNDYGLYLNIQSNSDISSLISDNRFQLNSVGLGSFAKDTLNSTSKVTGLSWPTFRNNVFAANTLFPIYLNGSATLEYFENTNQFIDNDHKAIALGGYYGATSIDANFNIVLPRVMAGPTAPANQELVPYVIYATTNFDWHTPAKLTGGLVFKGNTAKELRFYGRLTMETSPANRNVFTSYRDDSVAGDTNGTPSPNPAPALGDWGGVYVANPFSGFFSYATVRYSDDGLVLFQDSNNTFNLDPQANLVSGVTNNTFQENNNGLTLYIKSNYDITSTIANNVFVSNKYGLHTFTENAAEHCGTSNPTLSNNNFSLHTEFPIYLQGSANPTYTSNLFWDNTHPAIALGGIWCRDATWTKVHDNTFNQDMPYVVKDTIKQESGVSYTPTITLPDSLIVKFMAAPYIYAFGYLNMQSEPGKEIIFTSYLDDAYGGDINADGTPQTITRTAWKTVWLHDYPGKNNTIHDLKIFYATAGLGLYYDGPENTQTATVIEDTEIANSHSGIAITIGWRNVSGTIYPGKGNINATLQNIIFRDSNYGILTIAHDKSWGIANPSLENITFNNIAFYPIYLGGTSYPTFIGGNQIINTPRTAGDAKTVNGEAGIAKELTLGGFDLAGNHAVMESLQPGEPPQVPASRPQSNLIAAPNLSPAIGLAGAWNNTGELAQIEGVPYAITGNFPLTVVVDNFSYKPSDNVTIGAVNTANATVAVPAGSVFKFAKNLMLTVTGTLNLLSTNTQPVIFTSIKDDAAAGDTNRDGTATRPAIGDWGEVRLAATNIFDYAVVRYATKGLHIYFDGAVNLNNASSVDHSSFIKNTTGISLTALDNGDIASIISNSTFDLNTIHIQGNASNTGKTGHLCIEAHNNDLFGSKTSQNGIENNNLNGVSVGIVGCDPAFDATGNFWGHASGPYHPSLNLNGSGSRVSDRVAFDPWLGSAVFPPETYTISGRITKDTAAGDGLPGVMVNLQGASQASTTTDANGYYHFDELSDGYYLVSPGLQGYAFAPSSLNIQLAGSDALGSNFIATLNLADVGFSVNSIVVMRPLSPTPKTYCSFSVYLDKPLSTGESATVKYATLPGTAVEGVDFVAKSGTLTFLAGQNLAQTVNVELKVTTVGDPAEFFYLTLKDPTNASLLISSGTCTIVPPQYIFLPMVKK